MYGLPKIHKENTPIRLIVSTINSPSYKLAKELARILNPLAGNTVHTVKNSTVFVERIQGMEVTSDDRLVSFDIKSLFTQVPVEEALKVVEERLIGDRNLGDRTSIPVSQLVELTRLCLRSTYFQLGEEFYEQLDGTAMGSPLSPVIASGKKPLPGKFRGTGNPVSNPESKNVGEVRRRHIRHLAPWT